MGIFQKTPTILRCTDSMTLSGYEFVADFEIIEKRGNPLAIHGGRILFFELCTIYDYEAEIIAYYSNGVWYQKPHPDFEEGNIVMNMMIHKWRDHTPTKGEIVI